VIEPGPAASRWWVVALVAASATALVVTLAGFGADSFGAALPRVVLVVVVLVAYAVLFALTSRRARPGTPEAIVLIVGSTVYVAVLTALFPANAVLQFFAYPFVWVLVRTRRSGLVWSAVIALATFGGFAVSTSGDADWPITAVVTQAISFAVSAMMGLWISAVYNYAAERQRLLDELTTTQDELAALHRDVGTVAERERISREVHDTIAQSLTGVVLLAQRSRHELAENRLDDASLALVEDAAREALAETRSLVADSAPLPLVSGGGLAEALQALAARWERETGIAVRVDAEPIPSIGREGEVALLRCAQEAFANVRKHSGAASVHVALSSEGDAAVLRVRDDGRGFASAIEGGGFGLSGLRARLALVEGALAIDGTPGSATLTARVPRTGGER
jgi:signal transduction histidine kinase